MFIIQIILIIQKDKKKTSYDIIVYMTKEQLISLGIIVLILALTILGYFFLRNPQKITNYPPRNQVVVAFGDSLIEGVGSTTGNDFISIIEQSLNIEIINMGKSGDTTNSALSRLPDVLVLDPGVVIVLLGGNDFLRRVPKKETFQNLNTIIERLQNAGAVVVLLGVRGGLLTDAYNIEFEELAQKYHTAYVSNVLEKLITNPQYMYDSIHPNDKGYAIIASRVVLVLSKILK